MNKFGRENGSIFNQKEEVNFLESLYKCIEDSRKDLKEPEEGSDMTKAQIIELLKTSIDNENEYRRALGLDRVIINYEVINKKSVEELEVTLATYRRQEKYYCNQWRNR